MPTQPMSLRPSLSINGRKGAAINDVLATAPQNQDKALDD